MNTATKHLLVGGLVAMGLDRSGEFLLVVSHSGRGVYSTKTWDRIARDTDLAYPENGIARGIGPLLGQSLSVEQRDQTKETIRMTTLDGFWNLLGESDGITITENTEPAGSANLASLGG